MADPKTASCPLCGVDRGEQCIRMDGSGRRQPQSWMHLARGLEAITLEAADVADTEGRNQT